MENGPYYLGTRVEDFPPEIRAKAIQLGVIDIDNKILAEEEIFID